MTKLFDIDFKEISNSIFLTLFQYLMNSESIQSPGEQSREIFTQLVTHQIQDDLSIEESPSTFNLQELSRLNIKSNNSSRNHSRKEIIRVSKSKHQLFDIQHLKHLQNCGTSRENKRQCRICLEDQSQGRLIKPCKCTGSMQYAHENCLCEWIKRKIHINLKVKVNCQVCEEPFEYTLAKQLSFSYEVLKQNYQYHGSNYVCFFVVILVLLILWLALAILTVLGSSFSAENWLRKYIMRVEQTKVIFICILVVHFLIIALVVMLFLSEYAIKTEIIVKHLQNYTKKHMKILPKQFNILT